LLGVFLSFSLAHSLAHAQPAQPVPADQPPAAASPAPPVAAPDIPPAQALPPSVPPAAAPAKKEGFFDAMERFWDKSAADFKASIEESRENWRKLNEQNEQAAREAAAAAKEAADALARFPNTKIIEGRARCELTANGTPDCIAAAETICRAKGFTIGKSADIQSSRKCSVRAWLSGNPSGEACTTETFVTKAACQ
jgi:hypothetical protein